jgi:hypothetical protein
MKALSSRCVLLAVAILSGAVPLGAWPGQARGQGLSKWEYRVLTKEEVSALGKKDLARGLNKLGEEGWELAAIETAYIFKRPKGQIQQRAQELKRQIAFLEIDVAAWKERVGWSERMLRKGFRSESDVDFERDFLKSAEIALDYARKELSKLPAEQKGPMKQERKPEK